MFSFFGLGPWVFQAVQTFRWTVLWICSCPKFLESMLLIAKGRNPIFELCWIRKNYTKMAKKLIFIAVTHWKIIFNQLQPMSIINRIIEYAVFSFVHFINFFGESLHDNMPIYASSAQRCWVLVWEVYNIWFTKGSHIRIVDTVCNRYFDRRLVWLSNLNF